MRTVLLPVAALLVLLAAPARAESDATVRSDVTLLHLGVVGTVQDTPDLLAADLVGTASAADPATAQRQLDARMKAATAVAGDNRSIAWQVADYAVDQSGPDTRTGRTSWTARQTLHLKSTDADPLLALVGRLQGMGLAVGSLQWVLSPSRLAAAQLRASQEALKLLRSRTDAAAATLGLKVAGIRSVTLGDMGRPRSMPMMSMMAAGPAMPQASRADTEVSETVEAEIALTP